VWREIFLFLEDAKAYLDLLQGLLNDHQIYWLLLMLGLEEFVIGCREEDRISLTFGGI
tara:strand:+ start:128 stop:301 length:174 start_codon:yes stop_codon:yes gene_type:complete